MPDEQLTKWQYLVVNAVAVCGLVLGFYFLDRLPDDLKVYLKWPLIVFVFSATGGATALTAWLFRK